jgi:hypothetical protein
MFGLGLDMSG